MEANKNVQSSSTPPMKGLPLTFHLEQEVEISFIVRLPMKRLKNGLTLPTGQWYAPSAVINDAWYCLVLPGIAWYCMVLHGIAWYGMALHGIAWFCMVFHGIAWY